MKNKNNFKKGFVGLIPLIIAAILIIGGGSYFVLKKSPAQKNAQVENTVGDIGASVPDLNFTNSPLPDLNISSLNVGSVGSKVSNIFSAPSVNTDFSYNSNIDIKVPTVSASDLNIQIPTINTSAPTSNQSSSQNTGAPTSVPQSGGTQPSSGTSEPEVDCSQFASVPSCSYIGDPNGNAACKKCYPNK
jgi:hypothetical protein